MNIHVDAAQHDVFAAGRLRIEPQRDVEKGGNPACRVTLAMRRRVDAREYSQKGCLAGAVGADQSDAIAVLDVECHVVQRAHVNTVGGIGRKIALRRGGNQQFLQGATAALIDRECDREIATAEKRHGQIQYAMRGRNLAKRKKVPMQPTTVLTKSTVHEYASGAPPSSGARTTSTAAN